MQLGMQTAARHLVMVGLEMCTVPRLIGVRPKSHQPEVATWRGWSLQEDAGLRGVYSSCLSHPARHRELFQRLCGGK